MKVKASILQFREIVVFVLTLFIAPLTISLVADIVIQIAKNAGIPLWQWLITAALILVFGFLLVAGYTNRLNRLAVSLARRLRAQSFTAPSVLILDGKLGQGHEIPPKPQITDFSPMDWARVLAEQAPGWTVELGPVEKLQAHQVVINPFGETYPEQDPYNYTTFSQICTYVERGGVFVNVSGIPFWYCHNPRDFSSVGQIVRAGRLQIEYGKDGKNTVTQMPLFSSLYPQVSGGPNPTNVHTFNQMWNADDLVESWKRAVTPKQ